MAVTAVPPGQPPIGPDIIQITIEEEMRRSYLDYAMSVIVARALPDVRDGLKPVHRRILYSMQVNGNLWNRGYRKSARITGDVMGKYHPHGDLAIYDAMVRLAQDFSMRLPLVDGQGNFGSMDGDPPAANRYTEARLARVADALLDDLDNDTVDFQPNYDETEREPKVLPAGFPNLLVNGAQGIAVGMATNIPPHNLGEVIDACCAYLEDRAITVEGLMEYVPAPDFPTGGIIIGRAGTHAAFKTGRGAVVLRAKSHVEEIRKDRDGIVFTEMPYQVNKAKLQERIAECVRDKLVEGIADLRDESDRDGVRLVVELKRDADPDIVLNQLYRHTALQTSFGVNMLALNAGRPEQMTLRDIIVAFIAFREEVITRRTTFLLGKARDRAHILVGLLIAVANIDEIIALIRAAADPGAAREGLLGRRWPTGDIAPLLALVGEEAAGEGGTYQLTDAQARAILDLRLQRLTGLERDKIAEELQELVAEIAGHLEILRSPEKLIEMLRGELIAIKEQFANPRRTSIEDVEFEADIEALIQREDMVVTVSHAGYIKRVPLSTFRAQNRGGKGRAGMALREEDFLSQVFVASTLDPVLFFTSSGRVYKLKVYRLPLGTPQARGRPMINLLPNLVEGETISTIMPLPEDEDSWSGLTVMFATAAGYVRRNALSDFVDVRSNGKIAMKFEGEDAGDRLIAVAPCSEANDVLLATRNGKAIRFSVDDVRVFTGRSSVGVRGIRLLGDDTMISMSILRHEAVEPEIRNAYQKLATERRKQAGEEAEINGNGDHSPEADDTENEGQGEATISEEVFADLAAREEFVLSVTEKGFGVRGSAYGYRITGRGGQGINNMDLSRRGDAVVAVFPVGHNDQIMLVTDGGMVIRCPVDNIRIARRGSVGVVIFRVGDGERVVSVARLPEVAGENGDAESEEGDEN